MIGPSRSREDLPTLRLRSAIAEQTEETAYPKVILSSRVSGGIHCGRGAVTCRDAHRPEIFID